MNKSSNALVRWIFKKLPAVYLGIALIFGLSFTFVYGGHSDAVIEIIGAILLLSLFMAVYKLLENVDENKIEIAKWVLYVAYGAILIVCGFKMRETYRVDLQRIHSAAIGFVEAGKWTQSSYFTIYPFQKNWLAVVVGLYKIENLVGISDYRLLPIALNVVIMFFSGVLVYEIVKKLMGVRNAFFALFFLVVNPVYYTLIAYYYTFIPGLFFILLIIYLSYSNKYLCWGIIGFCTAVGYMIRATVAIAFVAVVMYQIYKHEKGLVKRILVSLFGFAVGYVLFKFAVNSLNFVTEGTAFAFTHWLCIGLTHKGAWSQDVYDFSRSFDNKSEMMTGHINYILDYYKENGYGKAVYIWYYKLAKFFGDGDLSSTIYNSNVTDYNNVWFYISGGKNLFANHYSKMFRLVTLFGALVATVDVFRKKTDHYYPIFIFMFGYCLFYTFWECSPRYLYTALPILQVFSLIGLTKLCDGMSERIVTIKKFGKPCVAVVACLLVAFEGVFVLSYDRLCCKNRSVTYISAESRESQDKCKDSEELSSDTELTQTFVAYRNFNRLELKADNSDASENVEYLFELLDDDGNVLESQKFNAVDVNNDKKSLAFNFDEDVKVSKKTKLTIKLSVVSGKDSDKKISIFGNGTNVKNNQNLYFDGEASGYDFYDIFFRAKKTVQEPYYPKVFYIAVMVVVFLLGLVPIGYLTVKSKKVRA